MEQPLVSVIVPVYNAGEHIARCIESIRRQSYQNLEIIIVNDGSKDVSLHVCEMYARVDGRILLIDKANSGVSATRNLAMEMAKGKYLQFADSDDYLAPDATRLLVEAAEANQTDLVIAPTTGWRRQSPFLPRRGRATRPSSSSAFWKRAFTTSTPLPGA